MFDFNVARLSKQIWPKTWLLNFWAATGGTISIKGVIWDWAWQLNSHWEKFAGSLKWNELPQQHRASSNTSETHRSSSMASSWLNFFERKKNKNKLEKIEPATSRWAGERMWKQENEHNMYWPGWWRHTELAQGHVAGSFFPSFFVFSVQKIEPATRRWASNEALSQLRGTEPATRELWICTVWDRWIFRCSLCSSNKSNYWLILAPWEIK